MVYAIQRKHMFILMNIEWDNTSSSIKNVCMIYKALAQSRQCFLPLCMYSIHRLSLKNSPYSFLLPLLTEIPSLPPGNIPSNFIYYCVIICTYRRFYIHLYVCMIYYMRYYGIYIQIHVWNIIYLNII